MAMSYPLSLDSTCRSSRRCGRVDVSSQRVWRNQKTRASVRFYGRYDTYHRCGSAICANECYTFAPDGCGICRERRTPQAIVMTRQVQKHMGANKTNIRVLCVGSPNLHNSGNGQRERQGKTREDKGDKGDKVTQGHTSTNIHQHTAQR